MTTFRNIRDDGILPVANVQERLALMPTDGLVVEQLDTHTLYIWNGITMAWIAVGTGGGGSSNSFVTIQTDSGTYPTASSPTDTLDLTTADLSSYSFIGNAITKTVTLSILTASSSQKGLLTAADWTTFNNKENPLTFTAPLVRTANTISIPAADTSTDGYLTSTDWNTFNTAAGSVTTATNLATPNTIAKRDGNASLQFSTINDNTDIISVDIQNRQLKNIDGTNVFEWGANSPSVLRSHADFVLDNGRVIGIFAPAATLAGTDASSSGTIPDGVYAYKVTVVINGEETLAGIPSFISVSDGGTNSVLARSDLVIGANSYRYYRATNPTLIYGFLGTNNSGQNYFDDGSVTPDTGIQPPTTSLAEAVRIDAQNSLLGNINAGGVNFNSSDSQFQMTGSGIEAFAFGPGAGFLFGSNSGNFNLYSSGAGLQFNADGSVNLYGTGGFNISTGVGSTASFHGNNSGLDFNTDNSSLLYTTKFQINMVGGSEIFETDVVNGVRIWDASSVLSADFQNRTLNNNGGSSILDFQNLNNAGLITSGPFTANGSIGITYNSTPNISLGSQDTGGILVDTTTYYWVVTAVIDGIESLPSNEVSFTMASPDLTQEIFVNSFPLAEDYNLYRGTSPGIYDGIYYTVSVFGGPSYTFIDDGTTSPNPIKQPPTTSTIKKSFMNGNGIYTINDLVTYQNLRLQGPNSNILDATGSSFVDVQARILKSQIGGVAVVFDQTLRYLADLSGGASIIFGSPGYNGAGFPNDIYKNSDFTIAASIENRILYGSTGFNAIRWESGTYISDSAGFESFRSDERQLINGGGTAVTLDWQQNQLFDSTGILSVGWEARNLIAASGILSIDWQNRILNDDAGNNAISWSGNSNVDIIITKHMLYLGAGISQGAGSAIGAGGSVTNFGGSNDTCGIISITTGTSPTAGEMTFINFNTTYTDMPFVMLAAYDANGAHAMSAFEVYPVIVSNTGFQVWFNVAPDPSTNYQISYRVLQN